MGFRIPHFQHFPPFASIIFLSFLIFQHPPCPPPGALPSGRAGNAGSKPSPGAWFAPFPSAARVQPPGTCMAGAVRAANGLIPGCRGRSPRQNKLIVSPFPAGKGVVGMGAKKQTKVRVGRRQERQASGGTCSTSPGGEDHLKRRSSSPPVPLSPWLPALPIENRLLSFLRRTHGLPPRRMPDWQVEPVPPGFSPLGYLFGRLCKCRRRFNAGVPGAKPPAK